MEDNAKRVKWGENSACKRGAMSTLAIVTDSTAYIPSEIAKKHNITITPQVLIWDNQTYKDGIDILPDEADKLIRNYITPNSQNQLAPFCGAIIGYLRQNYNSTL